MTSKRGDLLSLGLARLFAIAPRMTTVGLSATVREPDDLRRYLVRRNSNDDLADLVTVAGGAEPDIRMLEIDHNLPLAGHTAALSMPAIYELIREHRTTLVFVNTRLQAEYTFQELWKLNDDSLAIALHHGSLDVAQRRRVEEAMIAGKLKAVVCTATLDLGIDWGDVDLVINVGAPKGASRIMQRIGRSNHRMDEPSKAFLVPANRFEILECRAALDAVHEAAQDTPDARIGALDVLCQHILGVACAEAFRLEDLYEEVTSASPYAGLTWEDFEACVAFVATGGYALRAYERYAKIVKGKDGLWRVRDARVAQQYRLNVGTIVEATMVKVRLGKTSRNRPGTVLPRGRILGEIEEYFAETLTPRDTFLFAGEVLRFEGIVEDEVLATRAAVGTDPKIPAYDGGKFPLSTFLAGAGAGDPGRFLRVGSLARQMTEWLLQQRRRSGVPGERDLLVETFPRAGRYYMTCFPFEGRPAHQTLGMLLTRRMDRAGLKPFGYRGQRLRHGGLWLCRCVAARIAREPGFLDDLFSEDMLGDDLEDWLAEAALMKRTFRQCAVIAGLIERRFPGEKKTGRQVTISTDLVYDVLRRHEPDHVLLRAARADAATGLLDVRRLGMLLRRIRGRIIHKPLDRVSPLSVSVMLEIGRERAYSDDADEILAEAEATLLDEAMA